MGTVPNGDKKLLPVKRNRWYYRKAISLAKISDAATQISSVWDPNNNLSLKYIMSDRINKASKMADMVLRAIRSLGSVSVNLSLNIFDKQISPVVLYGSAIWATSKSFNLLYLDNQAEGVNARSIASRVLYGIRRPHDIHWICPPGWQTWVLEQKDGYLSV